MPSSHDEYQPEAHDIAQGVRTPDTGVGQQAPDRLGQQPRRRDPQDHQEDGGQRARGVEDQLVQRPRQEGQADRAQRRQERVAEERIRDHQPEELRRAASDPALFEQARHPGALAKVVEAQAAQEERDQPAGHHRHQDPQDQNRRRREEARQK